MGMFDWYEPEPPLTCPVCGAALRERQGKDAASFLFVWRQGVASPIEQRMDADDKAPDDDREAMRLPERFGIYSYDCAEHPCVEAVCSTEGDVWTRTEVQPWVDRERLWRRPGQIPLSPERFDFVVLYSVLVDGCNVLFRDERERPTLDDDAWLSWRHRVVLGYLPTANRLLPLTDVTFSAAHPDEDADFIAHLPREKVRALVVSFLHHLLEAVERDGLAPSSRWQGLDLGAAIRAVSDHVASRGGAWGFGAEDRATSVVARFLRLELSPGTDALVLSALTNRVPERRALALNLFELDVDHDAGTVTVSDVLTAEPDGRQVIAIDDLAARVRLAIEARRAR